MQSYPGQVSFVPLPVFIWPATMTITPTTASTRTTACPAKSEWPKVFGKTSKNNWLHFLSIDQTNGNMFIGG